MSKDLNDDRLRELIRSCITNESFSVDSGADSMGRKPLKYDVGLYGGILGTVQKGKKFSFSDSGHIGFPVLAAYIPRPATDYSPEYLEDVLEALKGKSERYYVTPRAMHEYIGNGCVILADAIDQLLTSEVGAAGVTTHGKRLGQRAREHYGVGRKSQGMQNMEVQSMPIVMQVAPSSSKHVDEFALSLRARLQSRGWRVLDSALKLQKVKIPEQTNAGVTVPKELKFIPGGSLYKAKKYIKPDGTADLKKIEMFKAEYEDKGLARWVGQMIKNGKTSVSISDIPAMFREHISGWIKREDGSPDAFTGVEPYIMMIVDDNVESGYSMREIGRLAAENAGLPPEIIFGATLINIANSKGVTGAPRRKRTSEEEAFEKRWAA